MIKIKPLNCSDLHNIQTGDYFPHVIDTVMAHVECFPVKYNTFFEYNKPAPLDLHVDYVVKDKWDFDIKIPYYSKFYRTFKEWAKQGHIFTFKLTYRHLPDLQFGRLIHVRKETLLRYYDYPVRGNRSKHLREMQEVDVIKLELESLTNLEACELIEEKNL